MNTKVDILGVEYSIVGKTQAEDRKLNEGNLLGYCDPTVKEIVYALRPDETDVMACADLSYIEKKTVRHEIIHAFLYESGLDNDSLDDGAWAVNEEMVDWFAVQFYKIAKAFEKVGC